MNIKFSLQEISKAINGDGKMGPNPLFRVNITLACTEPNQTTPKVGFSPTLESLLQVVCKIAEDLPSVAAKIRRLPEVLVEFLGKIYTSISCHLKSLILLEKNVMKMQPLNSAYSQPELQ